MATIIRRDKKDYGGEMIWVNEDPQPIYASPSVLVTDKWLDGVVAARLAGEKAARVDALYDAVAQRAARKVEAQREAERERLGEDYSLKTEAEVEAEIKAIVNPFDATITAVVQEVTR